MSVQRTPIVVFCSYAHEDEALYQQLQRHLNFLSRQGLITSWHDRLITPGTNWAETVNTYLDASSLILLLVSPNFLASDYCYSIEMKRALQRHDAGEATVIPILVRPVDWKNTPFGRLQALPSGAKSITEWRSRDEAWTNVTVSIRRAIESLSSNQRSFDTLRPDFEVRQQAISKVARADPANIQEVAASQLSIINSYYQSGLEQSQQSFRWSLIWGGIGLGFLIAAVSFLLLRQSTEVALASGIGGAIVEVFAGTYLYLYKHASDQLAAFRASLEGTQRLLLANSMCERLEGEVEQNTRAELIRLMVGSVVENSVQKIHEKKVEAK